VPFFTPASLIVRREITRACLFTGLLLAGATTASSAIIDVSGYITNPNSAIGSSNSANLTGSATFGWQTSNCSIPVNTRTFAFALDSGDGNPYRYAGQISGDGSLTILAGGANPVRIAGSTGNTYTGNTTVTKGAVNLEKTNGNALCGSVQVNSPASLLWVSPNQIHDLSNVTLAASTFLNLDGYSETINELRLVTGSTVYTGSGGVLKVSRLFLNGVEQPQVGHGSGDGFVQGSGYIDVADSGPPVILNLPSIPSDPSPAHSTTDVHPAGLDLLDWADSAYASSYDVFLWTGPDARPTEPTATVTLSRYAPPSALESATSYRWQVVARNSLGSTEGPVWAFSTLDRQNVSGEIDSPNAWIGIGNTANLMGDTIFGWRTDTCQIPAILNGFTLTLDSGGGNPYNYTGSVTGQGGLTLKMAGYQSGLWNAALRIGGGVGNNYSGPTTIQFGTVSLEKTAGDTLCGPITLGSHSNTARLLWTRDNQVSDLSDITMLWFDAAAQGYPDRKTFLNLDGKKDSISSLSMETGTEVRTGNGGILTARNLIIDGVLMGAGTYTAANHGFIKGSGQLVVTEGGSSGFDSWASSMGLTGDAASFGADPDHDGLPNAIEFMIGRDPKSGATPPGDGALVPVLATNADDFLFTLRRTTGASYLTPVVETSTSLAGTWTERLDPGNSRITVAPGSDFETITVAVPKNNADRMFARLKVSNTAAPGVIPPRITTSPTSRAVADGGDFTLTAAAGGALAIGWQWYLDGVAIEGATGPTYTVTAAGPSSGGNYHVVVTNTNGAAVSDIARVTITVNPGHEGLNLVPWPRSVELAPGTLAFPAGARIVATATSLMDTANVLASEILAAHARVLPVVTTAPMDGDIVLALDATLEGETHSLAVGTRATIHGKDPFAVSLGTTTLLQALKSTGGVLTSPRFTAEDSPVVGIRALALDLARFDHSLESLLQAVDLCRLYKINYLHLHFNDDQAYTFPSTAYPLLNTTTESRNRKVYTIAEMNELEAYAVARGVHIMPELEVPGHNALMLAAYPSLFRITYPYDPDSQDPDYPKYPPSSSINVAKADVRLAVRTLIGEMCSVFKSTPYIHLGCDEVDWAWSEHSPDFQAAFTEWGFNRPDPRDNVQLVFSKFISLARGYAAEFGKKSIVWENHAMSGTPEVPASTDILVMPFDSYNPNSFVGAGFKLINAAWSPLYVVGDLRKPVSSIYDWNPSIFGQYSGECLEYASQTVNANAVTGTQLTTFEQEEDMEMMSTRRRLAAMSERSWNPGLETTYQNFLARLNATDALLDTLLGPVRIQYSGMHDPDDRMFESSATATLSLAPAYAAQGLTIRYTTNRTDVTSSSPAYSTPLPLAASGYLRAAAFNSSGQRVGRMVRELHRKEIEMRQNIAAGKPVTISSGTDGAKAVDLRRCQGWNTQVSSSRPGGETLTVDLGSIRAINRVSLLFGRNTTYHYRVDISQNGTSWTQIGDGGTNGVPGSRAGIIHSISSAQARYVRLTLLSRTGSYGDKQVLEILVNEA